MAEVSWVNMLPYDPSNLLEVIPPLRMSHVSGVWADKLVIYGGISSDEMYLGDMWMLDIAASRAGETIDVWEELNFTAVPEARGSSGGVVVDGMYTNSGNAEFWIFGGRSSALGELNDLLICDLEQRVWREEKPSLDSPYPPPRADMSIVRWGKRLLMYGGLQTNPLMGSYTDFGDVWMYDFDIKMWTLVVPSDTLGNPTARFRPTVSLVSGGGGDGWSDALILHGGCQHQLLSEHWYALKVLDDVWRLSLTDTPGATSWSWVWENLNWMPSIPRMYAAMAAVGGRVWTFGGISVIATVDNFANQASFETNRLLTGSASNSSIWMEYVPPNAQDVTSRFGHSIDVWGGGLVMYGGRYRTYEEAADVWFCQVSSVPEPELVAAIMDTSSFAQSKSFSITHLLLALGILATSMCILMLLIQCRMERNMRAAALRGRNITRVPQRRGAGNTHFVLTASEICNLPLKTFADTKIGSKEGSWGNHIQDEELNIQEPPPSNTADAYKDSCSICLEHYHPTDLVRELPCEHLYHPACIDPWLGTHGICPLCKQKVELPENELDASVNTNADNTQSGDDSTDIPSDLNLNSSREPDALNIEDGTGTDARLTDDHTQVARRGIRGWLRFGRY